MCIRRRPRSVSASRRVMHDFVRDSVRAALMKARPVPQFVSEIRAHATASQALTPGASWHARKALAAPGVRIPEAGLNEPAPRLSPCRRRCRRDLRAFSVRRQASPSKRMRRSPLLADWRSAPLAPNFTASFARQPFDAVPDHGCSPTLDVGEEEPTLSALGTLKPLGQIREFLHPGRERRRPVDRRPARCSRACTVRTRAEAAGGA